MKDRKNRNRDPIVPFIANLTKQARKKSQTILLEFEWSTSVILHDCQHFYKTTVANFFTKLNLKFNIIKFTVEKQMNSQLPFVNNIIYNNKTSIQKKPVPIHS